MKPLIVGECSKEWVNGEHHSPDERTISQKFEVLCDVNWERGYQLLSWKLSCSTTVFDGDCILNESIVAVFTPRANFCGAPEQRNP